MVAGIDNEGMVDFSHSELNPHDKFILSIVAVR
jgi:hypothetical protein